MPCEGGLASKTLKPQYGSPLYRIVLHDRRMEASLVNLVIDRMARLNQEICEDPLLGDNFKWAIVSLPNAKISRS